MNKIKYVAITIGIILLIVMIIVFANVKSNNNKTVNADVVNEVSTNSNIQNNNNYEGKEIEKDESGNAVINSDEVTANASFYTYTFDDNVKVRLFVVKSKDGAIRTAFNTCQICNPSPKAYFLQDGDYFVCQNCGNKFSSNKIGIEKGGCNPIPITDENKTVKGNKIIINKEIIEKNKANFIN